MSANVKAALRASKDLPKTERLVLVAIAAHQNHEGNSWPAVQTVADLVGCSTRTVQRALAKLVQLGRLVVSRVAGIITRVYRLVTSEPTGVTSENRQVTDPAPGVTANVSPEVEEAGEEVKPRGARDWRLVRSKGNNPNPSPRQRLNAPGWTVRQGAALPPAVGAVKCTRHMGELAHNCRPCRSETLGDAL